MAYLQLATKLHTAKLHVLDLEHDIEILIRWENLQILRALEFSTWHLILRDDDALLTDSQNCNDNKRDIGAHHGSGVAAASYNLLAIRQCQLGTSHAEVHEVIDAR